MAFLRCTPTCIPGEVEKMRLISQVVELKRRITFLERDDLDRDLFMSYVNLGNCSCCPITVFQLAAWCTNRYAFGEIYHQSKAYQVESECDDLFNRVKRKMDFPSQPISLDRMYKRKGSSRFTWQFNKKSNPLEEFMTAPSLCVNETPLTILVTQHEDKAFTLHPVHVNWSLFSEFARFHSEIYTHFSLKEVNSFNTPQSRNNALSVLNELRFTDISPFDEMLNLGAPVPELKIYLGGDQDSVVFPDTPPLHPLIICRVFSTRNSVFHVTNIHNVFSELDMTPKCLGQSSFLTRLSMLQCSREHTVMGLIHEVLVKHNAIISVISLSDEFDSLFRKDFSPGMMSLGALCKKAIFHAVHVPYRKAVSVLPLPEIVKSQIML